MSDQATPNGLCLVDKPATWTSHDVVARSRGLLGTRKVGHAGTLDPMATGLLVLGVGRSTRLLTFLSGLDKTYEAVIRLGEETDSLDADGEVTATHRMDPPDDAALAAAVAGLTGPIEQVPPMVSAIKVDGRRLHQLAREGKEVERAARPVTVHRFDVRRSEDPMELLATVSCSSGTYVRVLAADLGHALGGGAHLAGLRRTSVGPWSVEEANDLDHLEVRAPAEVTRVLHSVSVDASVAADVRHGRPLDPERLGVAGDGPWAVTDDGGELLAVYERQRADRVKPALVLHPAG